MSWIDTISQGIEKVFSAVRPALPAIPPLLLICELHNRPGLSAIALTTAIIRRLNEAGITTGVNPDGSPNKINQFVRIFAEETIKEFKDNARITSVIEPGSVITFGVGANAGGPVSTTSTSTSAVPTYGIIQ